MSVKLDKTALPPGTNGGAFVAPGRQLYVLETNGSLNRVIDRGEPAADVCGSACGACTEIRRLT